LKKVRKEKQVPPPNKTSLKVKWLKTILIFKICGKNEEEKT
jgi:hypothetical protein